MKTIEVIYVSKHRTGVRNADGEKRVFMVRSNIPTRPPSFATKLAKYLGIALFAGALALSACSTNSSTEIAVGMPPAHHLFIGPDAATRLPEARELSTTLNRYLRGKHRIVKARYFEASEPTSWVAIAKMTASQLRGNGYIAIDEGLPKHPDYHSPGYDLIDVYPKLLKGKAFAVAMRREPLANGRILVGYFMLEEVGE
jgi:hypothetical protein